MNDDCSQLSLTQVQEEEIRLPDEILIRILVHVEPTLLLLIRQVNRQWYTMSTELMLRIMGKSWIELNESSLRHRDEQSRSFAFHPRLKNKHRLFLTGDENYKFVLIDGLHIPNEWNPLHDDHSHQFPCNYQEMCEYMISRDQMHLIPHVVRLNAVRRKKTNIDMCHAMKNKSNCSDEENEMMKESCATDQNNQMDAHHQFPLFDYMKAIITAFQYGHLHIAKQLIENRWNNCNGQLMDYKSCIHAAACRGDILAAKYIKSNMKHNQFLYVTHLLVSLPRAALYGHVLFFHFALCEIEHYIKCTRDDRYTSQHLDGQLDIMMMDSRLWTYIGARFPYDQSETNGDHICILKLIKDHEHRLTHDYWHDCMLCGFSLSSRHDLYVKHYVYHKDAFKLLSHLDDAVLGGNIETCKFILDQCPNNRYYVPRGPHRNKDAFYHYLLESTEGRQLLPFLQPYSMIAHELSMKQEPYNAQNTNAVLDNLFSIARDRGELADICRRLAPLALVLENEMILSQVNHMLTLPYESLMLYACAYKENYPMFEKIIRTAPHEVNDPAWLKKEHNIQVTQNTILYLGGNIFDNELWRHVTYDDVVDRVAQLERAKLFSSLL